MNAKLVALIFVAGWSAACGKEADKAPAAAPPQAAPVAGEGSAAPAATPVPPAATPAGGSPEAAAPVAEAAAKPIALVNVLVDELSGMQFEGTPTKAIAWTDKNGENTIVFSEKRGAGNEGSFASLYATLFAKAGDGTVTTLRTVKEHVPDCEFDLSANFDHRALAVTDLDDDGLAEVTFAYAFACRSDVSPESLKLLLLEGGDKYIIRGVRQLQYPDGEIFGGEKKVDESFTKGPKPFLTHALGVWARIVEEKL